MAKSRMQGLRDRWTRYLAGELPWGKFTPQDMELALDGEKSWRERFWKKHQLWLEAEGLDRPLDDLLEVGRLREQIEQLQLQVRLMEESSPGREVINAIARTRWFKRSLDGARNDP
jgi:hypothetical protein